MIYLGLKRCMTLCQVANAFGVDRLIHQVMKPFRKIHYLQQGIARFAIAATFCSCVSTGLFTVSSIFSLVPFTRSISISLIKNPLLSRKRGRVWHKSLSARIRFFYLKNISHPAGKHHHILHRRTLYLSVLRSRRK